MILMNLKPYPMNFNVVGCGERHKLDDGTYCGDWPEDAILDDRGVSTSVMSYRVTDNQGYRSNIGDVVEHWKYFINWCRINGKSFLVKRDLENSKNDFYQSSTDSLCCDSVASITEIEELS